MQQQSFSCRQALAWVAAFVLMGGAAAVRATDTFDGTNLSIPQMTLGFSDYLDVVVTAGLQNIVHGPSGTSPLGGADQYDPATNQLYIPAVTYAGTTYYNLTITVGKLVSIGAVYPVDTYNGTDLMIPYVTTGSARYTNRILAVSKNNILSVGGGMPTGAIDFYSNGQLYIPAVQVGSAVYTNVLLAVTPADLVYSVGGTVTGLAAGQQVTLLDTVAGDTLTITANGPYAMPVAVAPGGQYSVIAQNQPVGSFCKVYNGASSMGAAILTR